MCRWRGAANALRRRWIRGGTNGFPSAAAAACLHPAVPAARRRGARKVLPAGSRKSTDLRPRSGCAVPAAAATASCCPSGTFRCVPGTADMDPTAVYRDGDDTILAAAQSTRTLHSAVDNVKDVRLALLKHRNAAKQQVWSSSAGRQCRRSELLCPTMHIQRLIARGSIKQGYAQDAV
jgi:hypothetical protein